MSLVFDEEESPQGNGVYHKPESLINHLLLVWAVGYNADSPTQFSTPGKISDVIYVDCVDLDQLDPFTNTPGLLGRNCWWRGARLIRDLKPRLGSPNPRLVFMTLGTATKGRPPYELVLASGIQECVDRANNWFARNPDFKPGEAPATAPSAPAQPAPAPTGSYVPPAPAAAPAQPKLDVSTYTNMDMLNRMAAQSAENAARLQGRQEPPF